MSPLAVIVVNTAGAQLSDQIVAVTIFPGSGEQLYPAPEAGFNDFAGKCLKTAIYSIYVNHQLQI